MANRVGLHGVLSSHRIFLQDDANSFLKCQTHHWAGWTHSFKVTELHGAFASMADTKEGALLTFVGRHLACLLAEFVVEFIWRANTPA